MILPSDILGSEFTPLKCQDQLIYWSVSVIYRPTGIYSLLLWQPSNIQISSHFNLQLSYCKELQKRQFCGLFCDFCESFCLKWYKLTRRRRSCPFYSKTQLNASHLNLRSQMLVENFKCLPRIDGYDPAIVDWARPYSNPFSIQTQALTLTLCKWPVAFAFVHVIRVILSCLHVSRSNHMYETCLSYQEMDGDASEQRMATRQPGQWPQFKTISTVLMRNTTRYFDLDLESISSRVCVNKHKTFVVTKISILSENKIFS